MTQIQASTDTYFTRERKESPLGLLIAVIRETPKMDERAVRLKFRQTVMDSDYADFLSALVDEWTSIKFSTALRAAKPPTSRELRVKAKKKRAAAKETASLVKRTKALIVGRLMDFIMPNGKPLGMCTGAECKRFGGLFARIGKRVGDNRLVKDVLSVEQLGRLAGKNSLA